MASLSLITTSWLEEQLNSSNWKKEFRLLDCSWDLPSSKRNFKEEHNNCRIPGAKLFELAECRDKESALSNTMPSPSFFEEYANNFGLSNDNHIILYDNSERFGLFSAPRIWWLFNLFGHENVSILDGGLPKWKKEGRKTVSGPFTEDENFCATESTFKVKFNPDLVKDFASMMANFEQGCPAQVLDARPDGRFRGVAPEPRPDVPSGHMPKAINVPFFNNFNREENVLLPADEIKKRLVNASVDLEKPIILSCGSGITACVLAFSVYLATGNKYPLYDDSWHGWQKKTKNEPSFQVRE